MTPPDAKTIWDFKQRIKQGECPEEFDENPAVLADSADHSTEHEAHLIKLNAQEFLMCKATRHHPLSEAA